MAKLDAKSGQLGLGCTLKMSSALERPCKVAVEENPPSELRQCMQGCHPVCKEGRVALGRNKC